MCKLRRASTSTTNLEITARYGVLSMPTFLLFRAGEPVLKLDRRAPEPAPAELGEL